MPLGLRPVDDLDVRSRRVTKVSSRLEENRLGVVLESPGRGLRNAERLRRSRSQPIRVQLLGQSCPVLGEGFLCQSGENLLRTRESFLPALFVDELGDPPARQRILIGLRERGGSSVPRT
jgi:hypothetical protein